MTVWNQRHTIVYIWHRTCIPSTLFHFHLSVTIQKYFVFLHVFHLLHEFLCFLTATKTSPYWFQLICKHFGKLVFLFSLCPCTIFLFQHSNTPANTIYLSKIHMKTAFQWYSYQFESFFAFMSNIFLLQYFHPPTGTYVLLPLHHKVANPQNETTCPTYPKPIFDYSIHLKNYFGFNPTFHKCRNRFFKNSNFHFCAKIICNL